MSIDVAERSWTAGNTVAQAMLICIDLGGMSTFRPVRPEGTDTEREESLLDRHEYTEAQLRTCGHWQHARLWHAKSVALDRLAMITKPV